MEIIRKFTRCAYPKSENSFGKTFYKVTEAMTVFFSFAFLYEKNI